MVNADCRSIALWSVKAGSGTTTVVSLLARRLASISDVGAIIVDLCGESHIVLGVPEPTSGGAAEWSAPSHCTLGKDALRSAEVVVAAGLSLLPRGRGPFRNLTRTAAIATLAGEPGRPAIVDAGCLYRYGGEDARSPQNDDLAARRRAVAAADWSLLVTRNCPIALRRATHEPLVPNGVVLISDSHSPLTVQDVERSVGVPVWMHLNVDPSVARAVDAGLLGTALPAALSRIMAQAVPAGFSAGITF